VLTKAPFSVHIKLYITSNLYGSVNLNLHHCINCSQKLDMYPAKIRNTLFADG